MEINILAVVLAALSAFFLGYIWYTLVFAKAWKKEIGMTDAMEKAQDAGFAQRLGTSFVLEIVSAVILSALIGKQASIVTGLVVGLAVGLIVSLAFGVNYLFEGKTLKHWAINAGYNIVFFGLMGLIIGIM